MTKDLYTLMGEMKGIADGLKRVEARIDDGFKSVDERLARLEAKESERRGIWWLLTTIGGIAGVVGAIAGKFIFAMLGGVK